MEPTLLTRALLAKRTLWGAAALCATAPAWAQSPCATETTAKHLDAGLPGPRLRTPDGPPVPGRPFSLRVDAGPPGAVGVLLVGLSETSVFLPKYGVTLFPGLPHLVQTFALNELGASPKLQAILALDPALCGVAGAAQAGVLDPGAPQGLAFTNGLRLHVGSVVSRPLPGLGVQFPAGPDTLSRGDMDGDGLLDLVGANSDLGRLGVVLGRGDGSFEPVHSQVIGIGCVASVIADFDVDGNLDFALTNDAFASPLFVFLGNGDGSLDPARTFPSGQEPNGIVAADFDDDGDPDLAVANLDSEDVSIYRSRGNGSFSGPVFFPAGGAPRGLVTADFDGDGASDLALRNAPDVAILLGHGDATFAAPLSIPLGFTSRGVAAGDLDGDSLVDLAVSGVTSLTAARVASWLGNGDGTFAAGPVLLVPGGIGEPLLGDLDADGILDLSFFGPDHQFEVALGRGDGSFADPALYQLVRALDSPQLADFDGDGLLDLVGAQGGTRFAAFYRGQAGASFPRVSRITGQEFPLDVTSADFDGDGAPDLAIPNRYSTRVTIHLGDGAGGFTAAGEHQAGDGIRAIQAVDLEGDGDQDLVVPNGFGVAVLLGDGEGDFAPQTSFPVGGNLQSVAVGDLDGDGLPDLALTRYDDDDLALLRGLGAGGFGPASFVASGDGPVEVEIGDLDQDGFLDLATANYNGGRVAVHLGLGGGSFADPTFFSVGVGPTSLDAGDLDQDGIPDLAVAKADESASQVAVLLGQGGGSFAPPLLLASGDSPGSLRVADLDGDGSLDLVAVNGKTLYSESGGTLALHLGRGDGTFEPLQQFVAQTFSGGVSSVALDVFDLDGALDAAVVEPGSIAGSLFRGNVLVLLNPIGE